MTPPSSGSGSFANNLGREIEVAGRPTMGTVFALAKKGLNKAGTEQVVLGLGIGSTPIELEWDGDQLRFARDAPAAADVRQTIDDASAVAAALA
jgi:predicted PhzF superfamily epimerase YddE/YHI9